MVSTAVLSVANKGECLDQKTDATHNHAELGLPDLGPFNQKVGCL